MSSASIQMTLISQNGHTANINTNLNYKPDEPLSCFSNGHDLGPGHALVKSYRSPGVNFGQQQHLSLSCQHLDGAVTRF